MTQDPSHPTLIAQPPNGQTAAQIESPAQNTIVNPLVKWLEVVGVTLGGVGLIGAAIVGLGHKLLTNMNETQRVEKIAQRVMFYQFPQTSEGTIGLSIGAESFAVISDRKLDPQLRLFVQKSPVDRTERTSEFMREMGAAAAWSGTWEDGLKTQTDAFTYCTHETELESRKGNWIEARQGVKGVKGAKGVSVPGIEYRLSVVTERYDKEYDQSIRILATGPRAQQQAQSLLRSIQCRS